ncbi:MAG: cytochrome b [Pseudorhodoplanes sp.]
MAHPVRFNLFLRLLHWTMALLVFAMLFIGIGMVSTAGFAYPVLLGLHRPIGIALLVLVCIRIAIRLVTGAPALPDDLPSWQAYAAKASHVLLYLTIIALPLIGWGMLSAAGYPVKITDSLILPPILPRNVELFGLLRAAHTVIAFLFFALILGHLSAALFHALIRRDGVFQSMWFGGRPTQRQLQLESKPSPAE